MNALLLTAILLYNPIVTDGDTLIGTIPGIPDVFGKNIPVRIAGIDTAETHGACVKEIQLAIAAKERVKQLLIGATAVELRNPKRDKYFRINADVFVNGISIGGVLLQEKLAKPYFGQTKQSWC